MEEWRDIANFDGIYQISNLGNIRSWANNRHGRLKGPRPLRECLNRNGYLSVPLKGKQYYTHRLVAEAFIPNPDNKPEINHKNCMRQNNTVDNLEWVTREENIKHGIFTRGRKNVSLTMDSARKIREFYASKTHTQAELSRMFNVTTTVVWQVLHNLSWKEDDYRKYEVEE
jgi:hypothetical protein